MQQIQLILEDSYKGYGHSQGLARGLQLFWDGENRTQEGMGLGTIAIKEDGCTYFSKNYRDFAEETKVSARAFSLDTVLLTGPKGMESSLLTWLRDLGIAFYKKHPKTQAAQLSADRFLRRFFCIHRVFKTVRPKAEAVVNYDLGQNEVLLTFKTSIPEFGRPKICLMNELGADWFDKGLMEGKVVPPPSAWQPLAKGKQSPLLYSTRLGLSFGISDIYVSDNLPYQLFWGREKTQELCWAGFILEIEVNDPAISLVTCRYKIALSRPSDRENE